MKRLWDDECFVDDNPLTVNLNRLRRKLEGIGPADFIQTRKGVGFPALYEKMQNVSSADGKRRRAGRVPFGQTAFLVIEDTGIGIRKSDLPRIFERGFTGYNGRLDKKSTGIGLYLCRHILDRLSHTIDHVL